MTPIQRKTLDFIDAYIDQHRVSPTMREIQQYMGLASPSGAHRTVEKLIQRGHLIRRDGCVRNLRVVSHGLEQFTTVQLINELARRSKEADNG